MTVEVIAASGQNEIKAFNTFPRAVYHGTFSAPSFPGFDQSSRQFTDPLFSRVTAQPFLALRDGHPVGRIAASIHHDYPVKKTGFFGYFESLNDPMATMALLKAAARWLLENGMSRIIGPVDLSPHERLGLLIEGFKGNHHPGMPYNPPYYADLLTGCGFNTEINLYAYRYNLRNPLPDKLLRVANRAAGRIKNLRLREVNFNDIDNEGKMFSRIHNGSMSDGWGFVSLSASEGSAIWRKLHGVCEPGLVLVAEIDEEPAGLCLGIYPIIKPSFPRLFSQPSLRLAVLAVLPQHRLKGLEAALILEFIRRARRIGISTIELSQVADNNLMMNHIIKSLGNNQCERIYGIYQAKTGDLA
ncbi:GNAT family N-acetyltransferase [Pelotomaculum isophthalicicum JI]|uniref:GNAT family N-acetyltransferase n=1 Tax=Pelotomaculum isophthalicicum JI TaxID=947010 RepID=A0A9X4H3X8_9FIRM|nr:GNAT family N-acetyltransferase [Pelotomaculum isophthalicicum]MDF9406893.1 GNAT family N-acetyltransferase [Pelotomaculum isophthalicicum JI]